MLPRNLGRGVTLGSFEKKGEKEKSRKGGEDGGGMGVKAFPRLTFVNAYSKEGRGSDNVRKVRIDDRNLVQCNLLVSFCLESNKNREF